jgi:hypothetical protein
MADIVTPVGLDTAPAPSPNAASAAPAAAPPKLAPTPGSVESVRKGSALDDAFKQLDTKANIAPPDPKPPGLPPKEKPPEQKPAKGEAEPGEEGDGEDDEDLPTPQTEQEKKAAEAAAAAAAKDGKKPNLLREDRERQKLRADAAEKRAAELEAKHKTAEERLTRLEAAEAKALAAEKRMADAEDRLRLTNYERSEEYTTKYHTPFVEAYQRGREKASGLEVTLPSGETRPATADDFDAIMGIQNDRQASRAAKDMFGDDAPIILHHRERVLEANATRTKAIEEAKKNGSAKEKEQAEMTTKQREAVASAFEKEVKAVASRHEWYKEVEGDADWNKAIAKGKKIVDKAFIERKGSPEEIAKLDAAVYARAHAYSPMKLKIKRLTAEIETLKKSLSQYDETVPGRDTGGAGGEKAPNAGSGKALDNAFAEIDKRATPREARSW